VMATTSALAGTLGLPAANVAARIADGILGDDDDPSDVKGAYRKWLADVLGVKGGDLVARGIPYALFGVDTSQRAGLQDVVPGTRFLTDRRALKDQLEAGAFNMLGPAVSAGKDVAMGISYMLDGRVMDGLVQGLPLALRGPAKAAQMGNEGFTSATGNKLPIEVTGWDQVVQSAGFTPSEKAKASEKNFSFRQREGLLKQEKARLTNMTVRAMERGEDVSAQLEAVQKFNMKNPQDSIDLESALNSRATARAVAAASGSDIATLPRYLPSLDRYSY